MRSPILSRLNSAKALTMDKNRLTRMGNARREAGSGRERAASAIWCAPSRNFGYD